MKRWEIRIINQRKFPREARLAREFCYRIVRILEKAPELSYLKSKKRIQLAIEMADPRRMRNLNKRFRRRDTATNVLTFSVFSREHSLKRAETEVIDLGDVVVAPGIVRQEAHAVGGNFYAQFFWVLTHGILHSIGLDHERDARERGRMERIEKKVLKTFLVKERSRVSSRIWVTLLG